ncbi:MAG: ABC transporter substrate-binding protein, partial [Lacunisphaera sp.]
MRSFIMCFWLRLVAVALAGVASTLIAFAASPPVDVVLQLPYTHQFQFAGLYAAQAKGYFLEEGIKLDLRITNEERKSAIAEVLSGRAEFGIAQGPQLVTGRLDGKDLVVVAAIMQHSPQVLVARASDGIRTPHDLLGKRVALDQTSLVSEVRLMLEREGVNLNKLIIVPNRWGVDEIQTGLADAMSTFVNDGPYELEQAGIKINIIRPIDYGIDFYGDCLFTTGAVVEKNPALVEKVRRATIKGWQYALQHPDEMIDLIMRQYSERRHSLSRDGLHNEAREVARLINADLVPIGHVNEGRFRAMANAIMVADKTGKVSRMEGFVYASPEDDSNRYQWVLRWLRWGLVAVVFFGLLGVLANWRLRRLVDLRTRALQDSEHRQREIFDGAPAPIVRNDYSAILLHLGRLRADGVSDLKAQLDRKPGLVREWYEMVRVIDANRLALDIAGAATVDEMDRKRRKNLTLDSIDGFPQELLAIWAGADHLRLEKSTVEVDGRRRDSLINWSAPLVGGRPDYSRVQLVYTDLTEIRAAGRALRESEARFRRLFENSPLAIVEFDNTELVPWLEQRRAEGVQDLAAYFVEHPEARMDAIRRLPLLDANEATLKLFGAASKQEL